MRAKGLRFECTQCGKCCTLRGEYAHVYVSREEAKEIAALLGLSLSRFKKRYAFVDRYGWMQLRTRRQRCVFLAPDDRTCTIYPARPTQCRTFPFWREFISHGEWTDEVRALCEGVDRGRRYSAEEARALMVRMERSEQE